MSMTADQIIKGKRYEIGSGMGGVFEVVVTDFTDDGLVRCRVDMPRNPDWHRYMVCSPVSNFRKELIEAPQRWNGSTARRRVGGTFGS